MKLTIKEAIRDRSSALMAVKRMAKKHEQLRAIVHSMYGDHVKYPQLELHEHHAWRLNQMMEILK